MLFDIKNNLRDRDGEEAGTWMEFDEGVKFLVARKSSPAYKAFVSKKYRENEKLIATKGSSARAEKISEGIMLDALANHILKGWEGVVSDGTPVEYSPEVAKQILEEHDDLRLQIEEYSESRDNYLLKKDAKDAENLKK